LPRCALGTDACKYECALRGHMIACSPTPASALCSRNDDEWRMVWRGLAVATCLFSRMWAAMTSSLGQRQTLPVLSTLLSRLSIMSCSVTLPSLRVRVMTLLPPCKHPFSVMCCRAQFRPALFPPHQITCLVGKLETFRTLQERAHERGG
jgi:hypothetical protein